MNYDEYLGDLSTARIKAIQTFEPLIQVIERLSNSKELDSYRSDTEKLNQIFDVAKIVKQNFKDGY